MKYAVSVTVRASPAVVWRLLTNVERYPHLSPSMQSVRRLDQGELRLGSKAEIKQTGMPKGVWAVTELHPGRSFAWTLRSSGVTTVGDHVVEAAGDGSRLTLTVHQTGPIASAIGLLFGRRVRRWVDLEAEGFRRAAEGVDAVTSGT